MNHELLIQSLSKLATIQGEQITEERLTSYLEYLGHVKQEDLMPVIERWPKMSKFFPKVQELLTESKRHVEGKRYAQDSNHVNKLWEPVKKIGQHDIVSRDEAEKIVNECRARLAKIGMKEKQKKTHIQPDVVKPRARPYQIDDTPDMPGVGIKCRMCSSKESFVCYCGQDYCQGCLNKHLPSCSQAQTGQFWEDDKKKKREKKSSQTRFSHAH